MVLREIKQHQRERDILEDNGAPPRVLAVYQRAIDRLNRFLTKEQCDD